MKIRAAFVSNSSSSSFLAVTTHNRQLIVQLLKAEFGKDALKENEQSGFKNWEHKFDMGVGAGKVVTFFGEDDGYPWSAGIEIADYMEKDDLPLSEIKKRVCQKIKKELKVTIQSKDLQLEFGEVASG